MVARGLALRVLIFLPHRLSVGVRQHLIEDNGRYVLNVIGPIVFILLFRGRHHILFLIFVVASMRK